MCRVIAIANQKGGVGMGIDMLRNIAAALGCSAGYLIDGVEPELSAEEKELLKYFDV